MSPTPECHRPLSWVPFASRARAAEMGSGQLEALEAPSQKRKAQGALKLSEECAQDTRPAPGRPGSSPAQPPAMQSKRLSGPGRALQDLTCPPPQPRHPLPLPRTSLSRLVAPLPPTPTQCPAPPLSQQGSARPAPGASGRAVSRPACLLMLQLRRHLFPEVLCGALLHLILSPVLGLRWYCSCP